MIKSAKGFTLIELVLSLVILSIIAGVLATVLSGPLETYFWTSNTTSQLDKATQALDNMSRDLRLAYPDSIVVQAEPEGPSLRFKKGPAGEEIIYRVFLSQGIMERVTATRPPSRVVNTLQGCEFKNNMVGKHQSIFIRMTLASRFTEPLTLVQPLYFSGEPE